MLELKKLSGEETGVSEEFKADWEAEKIDFYEDVAYGCLLYTSDSRAYCLHFEPADPSAV